MPLAVSDPSHKKGAHPALHSGGNEDAFASPRARVLLVEDEYLTAMYAEQALLDAGFDVVGPAASAEEAIKLACTEKPEIVVMDIRLAGETDGVDAAKEILRRTGVHCIFASAYSTPEIRQRAESAAPFSWVPKPYTPQTLVQAVRNALTTLKGTA